LFLLQASSEIRLLNVFLVLQGQILVNLGRMMFMEDWETWNGERLSK
jgi:hypothetical protein